MWKYCWLRFPCVGYCLFCRFKRGDLSLRWCETKASRSFTFHGHIEQHKKMTAYKWSCGGLVMSLGATHIASIGNTWCNARHVASIDVLLKRMLRFSVKLFIDVIQVWGELPYNLTLLYSFLLDFLVPILWLQTTTSLEGF